MYREKIDAYFEAKAERMTEAVRRLVRIRSVRSEPLPGMPFGEGVSKALSEALKIASELGFSPVNLDNYVGFADINGRDTELCIIAHLDTVPEGEGWTKPPFEGLVEDGKIYGRGAQDNKGPAVAALFALAAARELNSSLSKNARLVLGTSEETGGEDLKYYFSRERKAPFTFTPDADFPVINTEKGRWAPAFGAAWEESAALPRIVSVRGGDAVNLVPHEATAVVEGLDIELLEEFSDMIAEVSGTEFTFEEKGSQVIIKAKGRNAHAAEPQKGNNALTAMLFLLSHLVFAKSEGFSMICALNSLFPHGDYLGKELGIAMKDEPSGELTLNLSQMDYTLTGFSARFDCRFPVCGTRESVAEAAIKSLKERGISVTGSDEFVEPHHTPADSGFVRALLRAYEDYTGKKGYCSATGGGTYVHGIEGAVAFGCSMPGTDNRMHGADEFAVIDDLIKSAKIFTQAILEICG